MNKKLLTLKFLLIFLLVPSICYAGRLASESQNGAVEGTAVKSTGEGGGTKYLREDGDGTSSWQTPAGSGDVTSVGDCTGGACFDGTSDGGTHFDFYDAQGRTRVIGGDTAGEVTLTLPITTGNMWSDALTDIINDTHIDWGTGANQVSAVDVPIADSGSYYTGTEVETALQEVGEAAAAHSMNGFESRSDSTLAWDNGTRTLTLASTSTTYYWIEGIRYSFSSGADETIAISDATGLHLIYIDSTPALQEIVNPSEAQVDDAILNKCLVATIYYNTTVSYDVGYIVADERHGTVMSPQTHHWLHDNMGAMYKEGFAISAYTLNTATDAAVSYDLSDGEYYDEDIEHDIDNGTASNQYEQVLQGDAELPVIFKLTDGTWVEQAASTLPYIVDGSKDLQYMDTDNTWTQTTLGSSKFMLMWVVATNDWQYPVKAVQGSQEYNTKALAQAGAETEIIDWGSLPSAEFIVMYQLIIQQANGTNVNGKIIEVIDYRFSSITGSSATTQDHGSLSGLSDDDHPQYALIAGDVYTGTHDFGGATSIEVVNAAGDLSLDAEGEIGVDSAQKQLGVYDGIEVAIPLRHIIQGQLGTGDFDSDPDVFILSLHADTYPDGIVITAWEVDCNEADPDTELNANLYFCDSRGSGAFPGASATLIDVLDTTTGNSSEADMSNSDLTNGIIATGKELYITIDADPTSDTTLFRIKIHFFIPES